MSKNKILMATLTIFTFITVILLWFESREPQQEPQASQQLTISASESPPPGLVYIAYEKGYFSDEGLDVTLQKHGSGKASLNAVLQGKANIGATSENPIMHAALRGEEIRLIATILSTVKNYAIIGRRDRGISSEQDLKGKKVGVTRGTNSEFLLEAILTLNGVSVDEIEKINIKPAGIVDAITNGEVDAISSWNPHILRSQKTLGDNQISFYGAELYTATFNLASMKDYVEQNPSVIEAVLRALSSASNFAKNEPEQARLFVAKHIKMDPALLDELWEIYNFELSLDQSLITTMENQAAWAISQGMSDQKIPPNFLDTIYLDGMISVRPKAVTVIH